MRQSGAINKEKLHDKFGDYFLSYSYYCGSIRYYWRRWPCYGNGLDFICNRRRSSDCILGNRPTPAACMIIVISHRNKPATFLLTVNDINF